MSEFTEQYKKLSDYELLEILANSNSYQNLAIETAKKEISYRGLTEETITELNAKIVSEKIEKRKVLLRKKIKNDKKKEKAYFLFDSLNPFHSGIHATEKIIRSVTIVFGAIYIFRIFEEFEALRFMFTDKESKLGLGDIEYVLPLMALPLGVILFWKRKKVGWIILSIFLTYSAAVIFGGFITSIGQEPSGNIFLDSMLPVVSPFEYIFSLFIYGGALWQICKENVRDIFKINKEEMTKTIGITAYVISIYMIALFV